MFTIYKVTLDENGNIVSYGDYIYGSFDYGSYVGEQEGYERWDLSKTVDLTQIEKFNNSDTFYIVLEFYCSDLSRYVKAGCAKLKTPKVICGEGGESENVEIPNSWTLIDYAGDWNYFSLTSWESPYNFTISYFQYKKEVQNLQKWQFGVRCLDADVGGLWEISTVYHSFYAEVNNTELNKRVIILVSHSRMIHLFGIKDWKTTVFIYQNGDWKCSYQSINNLFVQVYFWRNSSDVLYLSYRVKYAPSDNECVFGEDIPFVVGSSFFSSVTLYQTVEKGLSVNTGGYIKGEKINEEITCLLYTSPSPRDLSTSRMPSSA